MSAGLHVVVATEPTREPGAFARRRALILLVTTGALALAVVPPLRHLPGRGDAGIAGMMIGWRTDARGTRVARVVQVTGGGAAQRAGLRTSDTLVAIGGLPTQDRDGLRGIAATARAGQVIEYRVRRSGGETVIPVTLEAVPRRGPVRSALFGLVGAAFLVIGLYVAWRMPFDVRALLFHGLAVSTAASMWVLPLVRVDDFMRGIVPEEFVGPALFNWIYSGVVLSLGFLAMLLHFVLVFPRRAAVLDRKPELAAWPYAVPAVGLGAAVTALGIALVRGRHAAWTWVALVVGVAAIVVALAMLRRAPGAWWARLLARPWATATALVGANGIVMAGTLLIAREWPALRTLRVVAALVTMAVPGLLVFGFTLAAPLVVTLVLLHSYRTSTVEERQQIRWPLWSIVVSMVGSALFFVGVTLWSALRPDRVIRENWISDAVLLPLTLVIPVGFAVGILRYRLMDLDLVVRRTAVYAAVTAILLVLYLALVGVIGGWLVQSLGVRSQWVTVFGTLAVAAAFVPARNRVQAAIDRRFHRTRYGAADALRRLSQRLAAAADTRELGRVVCEELHRSLHVRTAALLVHEPGQRALVPVAAVGESDEALRSLRLVVGPDLAAALERDGYHDAAEVRGPMLAAARVAKAAAVLPLRRPGALLGVLLVGPPLSEAAFEADDRDYLEAVAGQTAVALANLDAPGRRQELEEAREIQAGLLPRALPDVPGFAIAAHWQPALQVAGDYYDVLPLAGGRVALCIADVTGKGMPAALLMSNLQATVKTFAGTIDDPAELCARVNRAMGGILGPGRFVTFFYGVLDPVARRLIYANAGHNPPLVLRPGGALETLETGGLLIGPVPEAAYERGECRLDPGDRLVLFTDGVTEAMNVAGNELFGEDRMVAALRESEGEEAEATQRRLLAAVAEFCGGVYQDDATVLVVVARA